MYDNALIAKQAASPTVASTNPATAGPSRRAALKVTEFSAIALCSSARSCTMSGVKAWRTGILLIPRVRAISPSDLNTSPSLSTEVFTSARICSTICW